ncbi:hypothetical protein GUJ93_ZPchr0005g14318 [Zizania palustris]|uniref:Uncharacterized protein n=1 Tax=Zizania palustris TaxID=103762 RepID=A0A8J5S349_ZIZPA|nr:hypothetical protein GUJ93_ZPchr0005g14318 [Zizania palustris]
MVGDLSLLAVPSASPVVRAPSKELHHGGLPLQGKRPQDPIQLCAQQQKHLEAAFQGQVMMLGHAQAASSAFQAFAMPDMAALIDVQADSHPDSVQLSLGIAEQCAKQEKILKFLRSGSDVKEVDVSLLAELIGHQTLPINMGSQPYFPDNALPIIMGSQPYTPDDKLSICEFGFDEPQQYLPENQLVIPDPLVEIFQSHGSALTIDLNGRILFNGNGDEMRDLLSMVLELNMYKREAGSCKTAFLVPYFDRKRLSRTSNHVSDSKLASTAVGASKSTANVKSRSLSKKKQKGKNIKERDLHQKNYFHASEAFLSILLDKDRSSSTILSLKKTGPEISELLTQCSIGIAGTGLAVLLSVVCKMAIGMKSPIAATRLVNTGVGLGLFWLSWAVNGLRDTITSIFRGPSDMNLDEEEVAVRIQKSMNDILFRGVTILAITALKFA